MRTCPLSRRVDFVDSSLPGAGLLFLSDPDATPELDGQSLNKLYGLTEAEVRIAKQLVTGDPIAKIASVLRIAEATAWTHLQNIFLKTNTKRQPQLIRLLLELRR